DLGRHRIGRGPLGRGEGCGGLQHQVLGTLLAQGRQQAVHQLHHPLIAVLLERLAVVERVPQRSGSGHAQVAIPGHRRQGDGREGRGRIQRDGFHGEAGGHGDGGSVEGRQDGGSAGGKAWEPPEPIDELNGPVFSQTARRQLDEDTGREHPNHP
ncbi:MAG: hypothetical protein ACK56I_23640, partial [bacterium]